jgi:hypothetical protein
MEPTLRDVIVMVGVRLMRADGAFITGSDFLVDGGATATFRFGAALPQPLT